MIATTYNGEAVYLLHYRADWDNGFELRSHMLSQLDRSKGGISARQSDGETLRSRFLFDLQLYQDESAEFRVALQRLKNKRVLCPFWPAAHNAYTGIAVYLAPGGEVYTTDDGSLYTADSGELPWVSSSLWLTFEQDWSHWEIHTSELPSGFTASSTAVRVPLLLGYFEQPPDPPALTDQLITCQISFIESSPVGLALTPVLVPPVYGPSLNSHAVPLFPLSPDWSSNPQAGGAGVDTTRSQLGRGRELTESYYPQDSVRLLTLSYSPDTWNESAALLSFFWARKGQVGTFWLPGPLSECQLTAPTSASSAILHVDNASLLGDNRYIALTRPGMTPVMRHVLAVDTAANTLTLDSAPGVFGTEQVNLVSLILVRFAKPEIGIRFSGGDSDACRLDFVEEPSETYTPAGEIIGQTMADLIPTANLYRFIRNYPGVQIINRYTSHERDLVLEGQTYLARAIDHDKAVDTITLDNIETVITADLFPGNPLGLIPVNRLEAKLYGEIIECQIDSAGIATNPISRMFGQISAPRIEGRTISVKLGSILGRLDESVPNQLLSPDCAVNLYSTPCGILETQQTYTGSIVSVVAGILTLSSLARTSGLAVPTIGDGYFSYGRMWTGSGETYETRTIYNSAVAGAGQVALTLSHPLNLALSGPVYFAPGCGGSFSECQNKYSNRANFRGFPYVPPSNPTIISAGGDQSSTGKK